MLLGIGLGVFIWRRKAPRRPGMLTIYFSALAGAFLGAKVVYLLAEGWLFWNSPDRWMYLLTGKSILGALLGGYAGVEWAKSYVGYKSPTGDWFATVTPLSIIIGRMGCLLHGCCLGVRCDPAWYTMLDRHGVARWPAVPAEILFNLLAIAVFHTLRRKHLLPGQHFHLYLIGYGVFRFVHEFWRDTPELFGLGTGYQLASITVIALGVIRYRQRSRATCQPLTTPSFKAAGTQPR